MSGSTRAITPMTLWSAVTRREPRSCSATTSTAARRAGRERADGLPRSAVQHRPRPDAPHARHAPRRRRRRRPHRLRRPPLHDRAARASPPTATRSTTTSASSSRGCARCAACSHPTGTLYFHIDYREAHYCKLLLDELFGRECFLNELIWAYDYGAKPRRRWPPKHDTILVYVKRPGALLLRRRGGRPRALHGARPRHAGEGARAASGRPTSCGTRSSPPPGARRPATRRRSPRGCCGASCRPQSRPGDLCLDPFAGSGTLGAVAASLGRRYLLMDSSPQAVGVATERLRKDGDPGLL